jgi:Bacterial Ig-like domain
MATRRGGDILLAALAAATVGGVGACARQGAPPGGPVDRRPPVVVTTVPDTFAVDSTFQGPVTFEFNERISERVGSGTLDGAVVVSPRTGQVRVSHSREGLKVEMGGGFKPGLVYRVTLLPVFRDMFNNQMRDPFDLVFSTGAPFVDNAVVGLVWDGITGQPMRDMSVMAVSEKDSTAYFAQSDTGGIYAFRYLPWASYRLVAFDDRNQNHLVDPTEPRGEKTFEFRPGADNKADTLLPFNVGALQPDTAHARVKTADALDSVTVVVTFDHYLTPSERSTGINVSLVRDSGGAAPKAVRIFKERAYTAWVDQIWDSVARLDSLDAAAEKARAAANAADTARRPPPAGDTLPRDTSSAGAPSATSRRPRPPRLQGAPTAPAAAPRGPMGPDRSGLDPNGDPLPAQRIVILLGTALAPNVSYTVRVAGVATVNEIPLGGGEAHVVWKPPTKDTTRTGARPDTAAVPDTGVVRDTVTAGAGGTHERGMGALPFPLLDRPGRTRRR